jgi:tripartite-type tricarboxylate transporter receptor subunit TctC
MPSTRLASGRLIGAIAFAAATFAALPAFGQSATQLAAQWPDRPVRLLVPVGAGGAADTLSRNLSNGFPKFANGQPLIVENRPGAGGTLAAAAVVREKPDGYTLFLAEVGPNAVSHTLSTKIPYDPATAFTPIIHLVNLPAVVLIRPTLPHKTLGEFVAAAKQQPGKFNYASAGLGNWTHLFMAYLNSQAGIDQVNVVYRSGAEMLTALLKDEADTAIITVSTSLGQIKEGRIRALAGAAMRPMPQLPDTPPVGRTIPGFDVAVWHGIAAPAGMESGACRAHQYRVQHHPQGARGAHCHCRAAGRRYRRRHACAVRRLHQGRTETLARGGQGRRHQAGVAFSRPACLSAVPAARHNRYHCGL